jgi:hypothetical protein
MDPKTPPEHIVGPFFCPICVHTHYEPITVTHEGRKLHTGIFRCIGCGFGFADPTKHQTKRNRR